MGKGQEVSRCEVCLFFLKNCDPGGLCRRYPPTTKYIADEIPEGDTPFPWVKNSDWCGEFREKV